MEVQLQVFGQQGDIKGQEWVMLDMFPDETIELTKTIQDVRDISKLFSDYTKSFMIAASATNNKFFSHFYNMSIDGSFNQHQKAPANLLFKGVDIVTGHIELIGADMYKGKAKSYSIVFYGKLQSISSQMGEDTLQQIDWSAFNHTLSYANVKLSWAGNLHSGAVVYPLWDSSEDTWLYDSNTSQTSDKNIAVVQGAIELNEMKPAIRLPDFIGAIFDHYDMEVSSEWLADADRVKQYIQPQNVAGPSSIAEKSKFNLSVVNTNTVAIPLSRTKLTFTAESFDNENSFTLPSVYTAGYTGVHSWNIFINQVPDNNAGYFQFWITVNGVFHYKASDGTVNPTDWNMDKHFGHQLSIGDVVEFYLQPLNFACEIEDLVLDKIANVVPQTGNLEDFVYRMPEIKVSEFFSSFMTAFNLILEPLSDGSFVMEPLKDWYALGTQRDWNAFIDFKTLEVKKVPIYKTLKFEHSNAPTESHKKFKRITGRDFGYTKWDSHLEYDAADPHSRIDYSDGELDIISPFNIGTPAQLVDNATNVSTGIEYQQFADESGKPVLSPLNLFYFHGTFSAPSYYINDESGVPFAEIEYPRCNFTSVIPEQVSSRSLTYSVEQAINTKVPINTLYQVYYNDYIRRIYDNQTKILSCQAVISLTEFVNLRLNDPIEYDGQNYTINSMRYDMLAQKAILELLTFDEPVNTQKIIDIDDRGRLKFSIDPTRNDIRLFTGSQGDSSTVAYVAQDLNEFGAAIFKNQQDTVPKVVDRGDWNLAYYPANSMVTYEGRLFVSNKVTIEPPLDFEVISPDWVLKAVSVEYIESLTSGYATLTGSAFVTKEYFTETVYIISTAGAYTVQLIDDVVNDTIIISVKNKTGEDITVVRSGSDTIDGETVQTVVDGENLRLGVNKATDTYEIL